MRLYDHLFTKEDPDDVEEGQNFKDNLNPNSLEAAEFVPRGAFTLSGATPGSRYQFERQGYFCVDPDTTPEKLVFNRTVSLRDTWAKIAREGRLTSTCSWARWLGVFLTLE